jgi:NIMA (never in mitosis gene a)-related kinase
MELAELGDMLQKVKQAKKQQMLIPERDVWTALHQIAQGIFMISGLNTLHNMNILHRDLKCANIFLKKDAHGH